LAYHTDQTLCSRTDLITRAVDLALLMRAAGVGRTAYAKILRETIFFVWETGSKAKYDQSRPRSWAARGLRPAELDYDHAIPMKIVIDQLLEAGPDPVAVSRILREKVHAVLITKKEHSELQKKKLGNAMPSGWDGADWRARYREAGIRLDDDAL
jgi:hypothetical protein